MYKHAIVIPTCAETEILLDSVPRFFMHAKEETLLVFSFNPKNMEVAKKSERMIKFFYEDIQEPKFDYEIVWSDDAIGFGAAVNKGLKHVKHKYGYPEYVTIANDDLQVTDGWQQGLEDGFHTKHFTVSSKIKSKEKMSIDKLDGKIGMVGPVSNGVFNDQKMNVKNYEQIGADNTSVIVRNQFDSYACTSFLSGYCFCISKEALEDLSDDSFEFGTLFDTRFKVGGYEDDDLMIRAMNKGYKLFIALGTFVGHKVSQTLNKHFKDNKSGLANGAEYLLKWEEETQREKTIIATYRTSIKCVNEVNQLHNSLLRTNKLLDGISILLTNNPKVVLTSFDQMFLNHLPKESQDFIKACGELSDDMSEAKDGLIKALSDFLDSIGIQNYNVDVWTGDFNERDERNRTHEMAEELNPDYIYSIDSDEIFEDRLTREHIQRIVQHPNPHRNTFSTSFINHWETMKLVREDKNYGGQTGYRLWKSYPNAQRIYAGNDIGFHCGNSPELGRYGRKIAALRMRHLSHVRRADRDQKADFYNKIDTDKKVEVIGNEDYSHINQKNDIRVSLYKPNNGLAFTMLAYEKEDWINIMNWFDTMYPLADRICLVWTGEWENTDWSKDYSIIKGMTKSEYEEKYKSGPCWELAQISRLYKVEWLHEKLGKGGLAKCRNAGIDYLHKTNDGSLGWVLFMDPDEIITDPEKFGIHILSAITRSDNYGYMFKFSNPVSGGKNSASESIRLVQLNEYIRLSGLVHETFEEAFNIMRTNGVHPNVQYFPMRFINAGLSKTPEQMAEKLFKYRDLLLDQLKENPYKSQAWVSLALQYLNDDDMDNAETCLSNSILCGGSAYLPFKEYAIFLLRKAKMLLIESYKRTNNAHKFHAISENMIKTIDSWKIDLPKVDTGGVSISDSTDMPYFPTPDEYMKMMEERYGKKVSDKNEESRNE